MADAALARTVLARGGPDGRRPVSGEEDAMDLRGKRIFTGRMQLVGGWELRPFAVREPDGSYAPCLAARKHAPGSPGRTISLKRSCANKEEAFELAFARGLALVNGA